MDTPPIASDVAVTISHFFVGTPGDVDNISKLIIDGMKGITIADDRQISDLVLQRRPLVGPYVLTAPTPRLLRGIELDREFIHVAIANPPAKAELRPYDYP